MHAIKTVRIKDEGFPSGLLINEHDFDAEKHELFDAPKKQEESVEEVKSKPKRK